MNDQQLVAEGWGAYIVIAVSFEDDRNAYNALTSLKELDSHKRVGVQEAVSSSVEVGRTALLAIVRQLNPEVIDAAMSDLGGTVLRRYVADVEAEIAAAEDAERKPSRKPARSFPAATGSTTRLPSTRSSTS
jgi:uncharacterized membrane protein